MNFVLLLEILLIVSDHEHPFIETHLQRTNVLEKWNQSYRASGFDLKELRGCVSGRHESMSVQRMFESSSLGSCVQSFSTAVLYLSVPDYEAFPLVMAEFQYFQLSWEVRSRNLSRIPFRLEYYEPFLGIYASWIAWSAAQEMHFDNTPKILPLH